MNAFTKLRSAAETVGQAMMDASGRLEISHPDYAQGHRLFDLQKFAEAEECFLRVVADLNSRPVRPRVKVRVFLALARTQLEQKKVGESRKTAESASELLTNKRASSLLSACLDLRGCIQQEDGDLAGGIKLFREALEIQEKVFPLEPATLIERYRHLASALRYADKVGEAKDLVERALEVAEKRFGTGSPLFAECLIDLGRCQLPLGDKEAGLCSMERAVAIHRETAGPTSDEVVRDLQAIGSACQQAGDLERAVHYYDHALKIRERQVGGSAADLALLLMRLSESHSLMGNDAPAMELLQSAIGKLAGTSDERLADALERLGELYTTWGRVSDAIPCFQKARVVWEKYPDKHVVALQENSVLLAELRQYAHADPTIPIPLFRTSSRSARRGGSGSLYRLPSDPSSTPHGFHPQLPLLLTELPNSLPTNSSATPSEESPRPPQCVGATTPDLPVVYLPANLELQPLSTDSSAGSAGVQTAQLPQKDGAPPPELPGVLVPVNLNLSSAVQSAFASAEVQVSAFVIGEGTPTTRPSSPPMASPAGAHDIGIAPTSPSSENNQPRIEVSFISSNGSPIPAAPGPPSDVPLHLTVVLPNSGVHGQTLLVPVDAADLSFKDAPLTGWDELSFDYLPAC
jgi:tetratricopeptide (TPR) repeat protein